MIRIVTAVIMNNETADQVIILILILILILIMIITGINRWTYSE